MGFFKYLLPILFLNLNLEAYSSKVIEKLQTQEKVIALTFDACGGKKYDKELINFLKKKKIPATFFLSGKWIKKNRLSLENLSRESLFEIENHGLDHRPASIKGKVIYGIRGTKDENELKREIDENSEMIKKLVGKKTRFYRPGTGYIEKEGISIAEKLEHKVVNWDIVSGDYQNSSKEKIRENILKAKKGSIIIMHLNHPGWNTFEAIKEAIPLLKKRGYKFVKLENYIQK